MSLVVNKVWPAAKTQDDIVKRECGDGHFYEAVDTPNAIGLADTLASLPNSEGDLAEILHLGIRMYNNVQEFSVEFGEYESNKVTTKTQSFPNITSTEKKVVAETMSRAISGDQTLVGLQVSMDNTMIGLYLKEGMRFDDDNIETFKPVMTVKYLKQG